MGRTIYLTEKQFKDYIKFCIQKYGKIRNDVFRKTLPDGYGKYDAREIGIPYDLYLSEFPMKKLVCYSPYEQDKTKLKQYEIRYNDTIAKTEQDEYIRLFINNNLESIVRLSDGKYDSLDFLNAVIPIQDSFYNIKDTENESIICEMSLVRKSTTKLPVDIWVDEHGAYKKGKHWQRLKFNPNTGVKNSDEFPSMTLTTNPKVDDKDGQIPIKLSNKDIDKISKFIQYNLDNLLLVGDGKMLLKTEFLPKMIRVGENGEPIYPTENNDDYNESFTDQFGYTQLVQRNDNGEIKYNFTKNGGLGVPYCDYWFDSLTGFFKRGDMIVAYGVINNIPYDVYTDGSIRAIK